MDCGCEKVVLCSSAFMDRDLIVNAVKKFGSQAIVISIDYKKIFLVIWEYLLILGKETNVKPLILLKLWQIAELEKSFLIQ